MTDSDCINLKECFRDVDFPESELPASKHRCRAERVTTLARSVEISGRGDFLNDLKEQC
jgi:hypothetical protein